MKLRVTARALLAMLLVIAACSRGERGDGPEPTSSPSTKPTPTGATSASAETEPSSTGTESAELTLRPDGLGEFAFGVDAAPALAAASNDFGVPDQDDTIVYQSTDTPRLWTNGSSGFTHEFGRTTCWSAALCLYFGGTSLDGLQFAGWWYYDAAGTGAISLSTADGIAPWSVLGDHLDSI
jgi:hypothetical protein